MRIRQAGARPGPACAVVGGKKDAAIRSPGKKIRPRDGKSIDKRIRHAGARLSPACAVVGGKKYAVTSPGKEIRARDRKAINVAAVWAIGLDPLTMQWVRIGE